ncbi:MAG: hypothetical protein KGZ58_00420 [Ignavibacteriales bacterium]|nr:hypothetical protein [Ignavibacteriales bacterium]
MATFSQQQIRECFLETKNFNELFDAFEEAIRQRLDDFELYRALFWNGSLLPDELCLFAEKLVVEFPSLSYQTYFLLAAIFETTYAQKDNYELALRYYRKSAIVNPSEVAPYLAICDCYDPVVNLPAIDELIAFLLDGLAYVDKPNVLLERLVKLYEQKGDTEKAEYYKMKLTGF